MAKSKLSEQEFTTIDGRTLKIGDYFEPRDFVDDDNGSFVKHDALLRVCKELFHIRNRSVHIVTATPTFVSASVCYNLVVKSDDEEQDSYCFESTGDCTPQNKPPKPADIYFTAMAETRASGRALRFLLGVNFCTKEEIGARSDDVDDGAISDNIVMAIEKKFMGQLGITIEQMRKLLKKTEEEMPNLRSLNVAEGGELMQKLNRYQEKLVKENEGN